MQPKGFWSYARGDDDHLDGVLTGLRKAIAGEVSMLLGHDLAIFQDIQDLRTGDDWAGRLRVGVSNASFLIPVLTPRFFNWDWCREEVQTYLRVSKEAGVEPRIFPIRFVEWDAEDGCELRTALATSQYMDLSNWRFENDPTQKSKLIYEFAKDVKARLKLPPAPRPMAQPQPILSRIEAVQVALPMVPEGPKYKTHVVDPFPGRGDFSTIGAAIAAAEPGAKIVVREGIYRESLRLSKPLEIFGEGDRERILVATANFVALQCDAPMARISGMSFRCEAEENGLGIAITDGAVEIENCVVESSTLANVLIVGSNTNPSLRRCVLRQGAQGDLIVRESAQPVLEDCEILGSSLIGLEISGAGMRGHLRRCVVRDGAALGYRFHEEAKGLMERCEAVGCSCSGIEINTGADPTLRECTFRDNKQSAIVVAEGGRGRFQRCMTTGNGIAGVFVREDGASDVKDCTINRNAGEGIWIVSAAGTGVFPRNDLRGNGRGAWHIAEGATVEQTHNTE